MASLPPVTSTSNVVTMMMYSDSSVDRSGFGVYIDLCNVEGGCDEASRSLNKALTYFLVVPFVLCAVCLCFAIAVKGTAKSLDSRRNNVCPCLLTVVV